MFINGIGGKGPHPGGWGKKGGFCSSGNGGSGALRFQCANVYLRLRIAPSVDGVGVWGSGWLGRRDSLLRRLVDIKIDRVKGKGVIVFNLVRQWRNLRL